jgi:DNA repair photolyase
VADLWQDWLKEHYPNRVNRVMGHVRDMHDGAAYSAEWGTRMRGTGVYADLIAQRFHRARKKLGLQDKVASLRCDLFLPPLARDGQMALDL